MHSLSGEGQRHEIVEMGMVAAITQMLRVVARADVGEKAAQPAQEGDVERRVATQVQGQTVAHQRHALGDSAEFPAAAAADFQPILRRYFHEGDGRRDSVRQRVEVHAPQTQARTVTWQG